MDAWTLTRAEIEARINGQVPDVRRKYRTLAARQEFVERQIDLVLLAAEARRRGLEEDPEVRRVISQALAHRLLELEAQGAPAPDEAQLRAFWEEHAAEYAKPARRRVAHLLIQPKRRGGRARARKKARELYDEAVAHRDDPSRFQELVELHSDDRDTRLRGGDLRYFGREEPSIPKVLRETAFGMAAIGDVALCESPLGFHVVKLVGRRGPSNPGFDDLRDKILTRLQRERRAAAERRLVESLRRNAAIEVNEKALRRVRVQRR